MRCKWRSLTAKAVPTSTSSTTQIAAANSDYTQTLTDHGVLASVGSVGDAYDNAMAESFLDSCSRGCSR